MATLFKSVKRDLQADVAIGGIKDASDSESDSSSNESGSERDDAEEEDASDGEQSSEASDDRPSGLPTLAQVLQDPIFVAEVGPSARAIKRQKRNKPETKEVEPRDRIVCIVCLLKQITDERMRDLHLSSKPHKRRLERFKKRVEGLGKRERKQYDKDPTMLVELMDEEEDSARAKTSETKEERRARKKKEKKAARPKRAPREPPSEEVKLARAEKRKRKREARSKRLAAPEPQPSELAKPNTGEDGAESEV
ncbi:uncharacterized protein L969DRAFT_92242 [Mixia osmundae IAM 14324]|uniref:Uncharacterized protein n=1 Tax=Mixia osmundae (strain CBS 9802 / IAM 14324 / JCM 22182 / KY 12970) TaxID=764103 RepID=G7DTJ7_MIXOS|nr:uncharacterized protein L969DRAFT_92242 [Mixia osmundae IAM 14324]KEI42819.1 hypothetical protein L969DRAFT_92242 [Mixia osmundae IAM 14324]GAA93844.1 hypothetical protein E5Q_00490 [Mixia osmundae IAM 14324]